jgi:membrane-associated phospholipid phosphatase
MLMRMWALMDVRRAWLALGGLTCLATVTVAGISLREVTPPADKWVLDHLYAAPGTAVMRIATITSGAGTLLLLGILVASAIAVWRRQRAEAPGLLLRTLLLLAMCGSVLALQDVIGRAGPPQQPEPGTYPSGHATVATAALFAATVLSTRLGRPWRSRVVVAGGAALLLVCASRMVLAEHWLVDVAAGIIATAGVGMLAATLLRLGPVQVE